MFYSLLKLYNRFNEYNDLMMPIKPVIDIIIKKYEKRW